MLQHRRRGGSVSRGCAAPEQLRDTEGLAANPVWAFFWTVFIHDGEQSHKPTCERSSCKTVGTLAESLIALKQPLGPEESVFSRATRHCTSAALRGFRLPATELFPVKQKIKLLPLNDRILLSITYLHSLQQLCGGFSHGFFLSFAHIRTLQATATLLAC